MRVFLLQFYSHRPTPAYEEIAFALRDLGHTVWVGTPDEAGDLAWHDGEHVVAVVPGPARLAGLLLRVHLVASLLRRLVFLGFVLRVRSFLRQNRADVVQMNPACMFWLAFLPLLMPRGMGFVLDLRQIDVRMASGLVGRFGAWWTSCTHKVCARFIYDRACFLHPAGARKVLGNEWTKWATIVPLGVGPNFLEWDRSGSVSRCAGDAVRFLYVGRLSRLRQLEQILFAVGRMLPKAEEFHVAFVGPDAAQGFYHQLIKELSLDAKVSIEPPVPYEEVPRMASRYDVALAYVPARPADWQYHPTLKVLEYRALGMPIIATGFEPNRDLVEHGMNGLLVENSAESLAQAMLTFVQDRDFLERCRSHAQTMRQGTTWKEVAQMYEQDVYRQLGRR